MEDGIPHQQSEPEEGPLVPPGRGASRMLRGLMLRMKTFFLVFNVFKIFVKIFVHNDMPTGSVVTYLIFESCDIVISHGGIADIKKHIGTAKHKLRANDESQSRKLQNLNQPA